MIQYIVGPAVGAVIGYITNDIAIRMLFRPHQAKYIWGFHIPFTPGIIPKERGRIAASIGAAISENLMNRDVLEKNLLSDEMIGKISEAIDDFFRKQQRNPETLRQFLGHYLSEEELNSASQSVGAELTKLIHRKLADPSVGNQIAHVAVQHVMKKMQHAGSSLGDALKDEGIGPGGGIGDMLGRAFGSLFGNKAKDTASEFISALAEPVEQLLAKNINEMLQNNSRQIMGDLISTETDHLLDQPMQTLLADKEQQMEQARVSILGFYRNVITNELPRILEAVNISKIIESRINEMDVNETECLIFAVMDKELKAIVWLGAGLGFIMGFVNALI